MAEALGLVANVIAVVELSAKVASLCFEYYTNVKNARDDIARLRRESDGLKVILKQVQSLLNGPNSAKLEASRTLRNGVDNCFSQLADLETKLESGRRHQVMRRFGAHALKWPFKNKEVEGIVKDLGRCKDMISLGLQVDQTALTLDVHQEIVLAKLRTAEGAAFDCHADEHDARCHPDTRVDLLHQIDDWAGDPDSKCIFWLNGMAGTGKSTISRTVAHNFADKGELGASFFYKRGEGDRGHAALFFTTITAQLVLKLPSLAPHVRNAIEADPAISGKTMKDQFEKLVLKPLDKIHSDRQNSLRRVVVVDALDECDREEDVRIIIHLLSQVKHLKSVHLKLFVTSRPELPIRLGFEDISGKYKGMILHQIPNPIIEHDISAFLEYELARIRDDYNKSVTRDRQLHLDWPGQTSVQNLVGMAIPLFIFAATVCRFIKDRKCGPPEEQLAKVLQYQTKSQESKLDATYLPVLNQLLVGLTASERRHLVRGFREVVGSIVILASPLSTTSLARLLEISKGAVDCKIDLLHSVLSIPSNPDVPVRLLHLSFRDFLLDPEKRETNPFWVDEKEAHNKLATQCLERLSADGNLKEDICNLRTPAKLQREVNKHTIDACLPSDIQYACQYWVYHLKQGRGIICDDDQVYSFLTCHFLHWLEALSFIGRLSESIGMIDNLVVMVEPITGTKVSSFLHDAKRFVLSYRSIIDSSPLQLYSSALIFAPKESIIRNTFRNYIPGWISLQPKVDLDWSAVLQTLEGHSDQVTSVAFSHDSKLLASASHDHTVKVWDAATGSLQQTLQGHSASVTSVAFSHDSKLLASASYNRTVRVWDIATGSLQRTLEGHSDIVMSVAFSHDSKLLASSSYDRTVKVWDAATGSLQQTLEGHSNSVVSVAFSHDSKILASASYDRTIKVWDAATGSLQQTLEGHSDSVMSVAFSHDSKLLVSASRDGTVKVWDAATGSLEQTLEGHIASVTSVAFSHDSKLLVSASRDGTVKVWDAAAGSLEQTLEGHIASVTSVAFSHDSKLLASASHDSTVKVWDAATGSLQQTLESHSDSVISVAFSHDSKLLASASHDSTVKIWDAATGSLQQTLEGHSNSVVSVAFSHDSKLLASASRDHTVKVWDAATGSLRRTLESHSSWVMSVAFSHDSKLLASASRDGTVKVWDAATGSLQQTLEGHSGSVMSVAFSHDSKLLASASHDSTAKVWDVATGSLQQTLKSYSGSVMPAAFSHDSKLLALVSDDYTVKVWDTVTSSCRQAITTNDYIKRLSFDSSDLNILTNIGRIKVDEPVLPPSKSSQELGGRGNRQEWGISGSWVTWDGQNLLWLPPDYRAFESDISQSGSRVAFGCRTGGVFIIGLSSAVLHVG